MNNPEREIVIATINGLRHAMAWKLIKPLNEGWNAAAFGQQPLDCEMVLHQVKARTSQDMDGTLTLIFAKSKTI